MKKYSVIISFTLLTLLLAACGGQPTATPAVTTLPPMKDTAVISAQGKLEPVQFVTLSFVAGGEVVEVLVKEGDVVNANDVLARVRAGGQLAALARAEAGVVAAKASEAKYLEQLPQQIAAAEADVQLAQAQIAEAEVRTNNQAEIAAAEAALAQAQLNQKSAEDAHKRIIEKNQLGPTEEQARLVEETSKRATEAAQWRLDQLKTDRANAVSLAAAQAHLSAAEANLSQLQAEANGRPNPTFATAIQQADAALQSAKVHLANTELRAPFAGAVAQLKIKAGETVGPGASSVILADLSVWQIKTDDFTEIKVPTIKAGQPVTIKADALPDVTLKGEVVAIGLQYQEKNGEIVYPVTVKLLDNDPRLRWGMTVNVTAIPEAAQAATTVDPATTVDTATAAEGKVLPLQWATLSFISGGEVAELLVEEGDHVKAGEVIARLRNDILKAAVAEAEAGLATIKANRASYLASLPKQVAATEAEIKAAQSQAASAASGRKNDAAIKDMESQLAQARYAQQRAEATVNMFYEFKLTDRSQFKTVQLSYANAVKATHSAEARLAALQSGSPSDRAASAQINAAAASQTAAEARLNQLQAELAGTATDTFAAQIRQAEAVLKAAQLALAETEITAPFDGTITTINVKTGEQAKLGSPAVVLADLSGWTIETNDVTEFKVPNVRAGQNAIIQFDALPELTLRGQVESIAAMSQLRSNDVVYPVQIKLVDSDPQLRWGMTVAVAFEK